jgi:protein-tyrosine-phosphatase
MAANDASTPVAPIIPQTGADRRVRTVLFLCTGNFYRSRFAELYFNHLAEERDLKWRAVSRGLRLTDKNVGPIATCTLAALTARGAAAPADPGLPRQATIEDFAAADLVIAVKRAEHEPMIVDRFPQWKTRVRYWGIHDVDFAPTEQALAELEMAVKGLVEELLCSDVNR